MKTKALGIVIGAAFICCAYVHRRVIKAMIQHEEMPKAPAWHFWVTKDQRRD